MAHSPCASSSVKEAIWQYLAALTVLELLGLLVFFSKTAQLCNCHQTATCLPGKGCPTLWAQNFCRQLHSRVAATPESTAFISLQVLLVSPLSGLILSILRLIWSP